jgi:hypothetical protein
VITFGIKNIDVEQLVNVTFPTELFIQHISKPAQVEDMPKTNSNSVAQSSIDNSQEIIEIAINSSKIFLVPILSDSNIVRLQLTVI